MSTQYAKGLHKVSDRMKRKQELAKQAQRFSRDFDNHASNQRQLRRHTEETEQ